MLDATFDPRRNALNLVRLLLAVGVIFVHSFALTGVQIGSTAVHQVFTQAFVDGFFAISGFLIVSSWDRRPEAVAFLRARLLRILPGFWTCLVVTAAVLAPIGILLSGRGFPAHYLSGAAHYVIGDAAVFMRQFDIAGTPVGLADPGWNGSLWTLWYELCCYLAVLALGVTGVLRRRWTIPILFALSVVAVVLVEYLGLASGYAPYYTRFASMFAAGALLHRFRHRVPVHPALLAVAAGLVVLSAPLPSYRLVAALPIAYLLIVGASMLKAPRLSIRTDVSYGVYIYAFPVQQILVTAGAGALGVALFGLVALAITLPLALASWLLVEKPSLRLKSIPLVRVRRWAAPSGVRQQG